MEQTTNNKVSAMLTIAISALLTLTGMIAVAVIADNLNQARVAYTRLMVEGEMMRAGMAQRAAAAEMHPCPTVKLAPKAVSRPVPAAVMQARRSAALRPSRQFPLQACVAA